MFEQLTIQTREYLLNRLLGVDQTTFINPPESSSPAASQLFSPAEDLKRALNQLKSEAISEDGHWVDYPKIAYSTTYREYRRLAAALSSFNYLSLSSREEQLAFWINLYNSLVIDAVIQEGIEGSVINSPLGGLGFFQKAAYQVNGLRFSLTDIEHGVLRRNRGIPYLPGAQFPEGDQRMDALPDVIDPRIHFALNCASRSCPPIGIYSGENIEHQLDLAAGNFINQETRVDTTRKTISISRIFRWYGVDFGGKKGIRAFILRYLSDMENGRWNRNDIDQYRILFHPYDWKLNFINPGN